MKKSGCLVAFVICSVIFIFIAVILGVSHQRREPSTPVPVEEVTEAVTTVTVPSEEFVETSPVQEETTAPITTEEATITTKKQTTAKQTTRIETTTTTVETTANNNSFDSNSYYDVTDESLYTDTVSAHKIYKVSAKENVTIKGTGIIYGSNGEVLGKCTDTIVLTKGKNNYFKFSFDKNILNDPGANISVSGHVEDDTWSSMLSGERNAVEATAYNVNGSNLYVTFRQTADDLSYFAKFKLLLYKNGKIVGDEIGYFSTYAENLNGKGTEDIASLWVYGKDFDKVEYIFEP